MPLLKYFDKNIQLIEQPIIPKFKSKILHLLSEDEAAKHEQWLLDFFGDHIHIPPIVSLDGESLIATPIEASKVHKKYLKLNHIEIMLKDDIDRLNQAEWLEKKQWSNTDEIWESDKAKEADKACPCCGVIHVPMPNIDASKYMR